jgi:hypothetical protein
MMLILVEEMVMKVMMKILVYQKKVDHAADVIRRYHSIAEPHFPPVGVDSKHPNERKILSNGRKHMAFPQCEVFRGA